MEGEKSKSFKALTMNLKVENFFLFLSIAKINARKMPAKKQGISNSLMLKFRSKKAHAKRYREKFEYETENTV